MAKGRMAPGLKPGDKFTSETNHDVVLWRISYELYAGPASGLRELIANAVRAVLQAVEAGITAPEDAEIYVGINAEKELVISDNGIGMDEETYSEYVLRLGKSSNKDRSMPGKFGMGIASHATLSSTMFIDSMYVKDGERRTMVSMWRECRMSTDFDPSVSQRTRPGTTIKLMLYDNNTGYEGTRSVQRDVRLSDLYDMLWHIGRHTRVRIVVDVSETGMNPVWAPGGRHTFEPRGIPDAAREWRERGGLDTVVHERGDNWEAAVDFYPATSPVKEAFLAGMPIRTAADCEYQFAVNMEDEDAFEPMPNREDLSAKGSRRLQEILNGITKKHRAGASKIRDYGTYLASEYKAAFLCNPSEGGLTKRLFTDGDGEACSLRDVLLEAGEDHVYLPPARGRAKKMASAVLLGFRDGARREARALARRWGIPTAPVERR